LNQLDINIIKKDYNSQAFENTEKYPQEI